MGITKRDSPISWRPSSEARLALARLLARGGKKRNEIINDAVIRVEAMYDPPSEVMPVDAGVVNPVEPSPVDAGEMLAKAQTAMGARKVTRQGIDPDKVAAAQDWLKKPGRKK